MGVWERSPAGLAIARANPSLMTDCRRALPDVMDRDIVGSPYCVRRYVVDAALGGPDGLAEARKQLAGRGLGLMLDFVPNHVAPDHPWVDEHPEYFVRGIVRIWNETPHRFWKEPVRCTRAVEIPTSRPGRMCCSSMPSIRGCAGPRSRPSRISRINVTACVAIWPCCSSTRSLNGPGESGPVRNLRPSIGPTSLPL